MVPRLAASKSGLCFFLLIPILICFTPNVSAQYGYGGHYQEVGSGSGGTGGPGSPDPAPTPQPIPTATPTPRPADQGQVSLRLAYVGDKGIEMPFPAQALPGETISIVLDVTAIGSLPGQFRLSSLALDDRVGTLAPSRSAMSGSGSWRMRLQSGDEPGVYPLLFVAQDTSGAYPTASIMGTVTLSPGEPLLMVDGAPIRPAADSRELRAQNRSWWAALTLRNWTNPQWFEHLCDDLSHDRGLLDAVSKAVRIDRDRLNITHQMPPKEAFRSYVTMEPIMSKYWADTGITLSAATANEIGNVMINWRASPGLTIETTDDVMRILKIRTPTIKVGNVLNGVGAAMILLDFWSNMSAAESPAEARDAWNKAGYASLDLYLSNVVANTFGAAAALPGMFTSYILMNSYDTLMGGHKRCWFNKMVEQAVDANYLSDDIKDTRSVNQVKSAMLSRKGLKGTLNDWWALEAPTWSGMMAGGCGNWDLAEARGYREAFVDRIMRTAEVDVDGKKYHPWSFYYSVSRMIAIEKQQQLARETATKLRDLEGAYLSSLAKRNYQGTFRVVRADNPEMALTNASVRPLEWEGAPWWQTDQEGFFTAQVNGHHFSPNGEILLMVMVEGKASVFVVSRSAFVEVTR